MYATPASSMTCAHEGASTSSSGVTILTRAGPTWRRRRRATSAAVSSPMCARTRNGPEPVAEPLRTAISAICGLGVVQAFGARRTFGHALADVVHVVLGHQRSRGQVGPQVTPDEGLGGGAAGIALATVVAPHGRLEGLETLLERVDIDLPTHPGRAGAATEAAATEAAATEPAPPPPGPSTSLSATLSVSFSRNLSIAFSEIGFLSRAAVLSVIGLSIFSSIRLSILSTNGFSLMAAFSQRTSFSLTSLRISLEMSFSLMISLCTPLPQVTVKRAVIEAPDALMLVTETQVSVPAKDLEFGVEVPVNDVLLALPGNGSPVSPRPIPCSSWRRPSAWRMPTL